MQENERMRKFAEEYYRKSDELYPSMATVMGIHHYDHEIEDLSPEGIEKSLEFHRQSSEEIEKIDFDKLGNDEKIMFHIINSNIKATLRDIERRKIYETNPAIYADLANNSVFLLLLRDFAPMEERLKAVASRLHKIPSVFEAGKKNVKNPPRVYVDIALNSLKGSGGLLKDMIPRLAEKYPLLKPGIDAGLEKTIAATDDFIKFLENEILPHANGNFAAGKEMFDEMLRESDFMDLTSDDLWEIGQREAKKCEEELIDFCKRKMDPGKTWKENFLEVKKHHPSSDDILPTYQKYLQNAKEFVIKNDLVTIPDNQKVTAMETPEFLRNLTPLAAYMPPAPFEEDQSGYLLVTPINKEQPEEAQEKQMMDNCYGKISYVSLHECYPGHHLQLVYSSGVENPVFKRIFSNIFIEGWAFYTEQLLKDQGYFDVEGEICQLEAAYFRANRVLLDVGLHTGRFTMESALEFMKDKTTWSPYIALGEIQRYTSMPTQALSYYTGKLEIFRIMEDYKKLKGDKFSLKEFHEALLTCGSMPPKLIEWKLGMKEIERPAVKTEALI